MAGEIRNVACLFCGCLCDDLRIIVEQGRVTHAEGACADAFARLLSAHEANTPPAEIDGSPTTLQAAVHRAAKVLSAARSPLIYGLSRSATDGQRAAIALAEQIGATIDTPSSSEAAASLVAYQSVGQSTCTLGEVRNRADFVLFWRCDPLTTHPRHGERYSIYPAGEFLPRGRADRTIVVADERRNATAEVADLFLPLQSGRDFETLWALRCRVRRLETDGQNSAGTSADLIADVVARAKAARYGVVFYETKSLGPRDAEALFRLVTDLNAYTRFSILALGAPGSLRGAENVLTWQTGYPCSISMARGYPRYGPGEFSAGRMLEANEADACLLVGADPASNLSAAANAAFEAMPTIALDPPAGKSTFPANVRIRVSSPGVHHSGTAYRVDGVGIPLRGVLPSSLPSDAAALEAIRAQLSSSSS